MIDVRCWSFLLVCVCCVLFVYVWRCVSFIVWCCLLAFAVSCALLLIVGCSVHVRLCLFDVV